MPPFLDRLVVGLPRMRGDRPFWGHLLEIVSEFTPHARGSTSITSFPRLLLAVYPACAGIDRVWRRASIEAGSLPRMRGDRPWLYKRVCGFSLFTPHARGSTASCLGIPLSSRVYPACAGIDPILSCFCACQSCLPRMRGDRPEEVDDKAREKAFTPHARGSTLALQAGLQV